MLHLPDETKKLIREKFYQLTQDSLHNVGGHCIYLREEEGGKEREERRGKEGGRGKEREGERGKEERREWEERD